MPREATQFKPGQSGNPSGRPKRKPITEALLRELASATRGGGTKAEAAAKRLVGLMLKGNLEAAKLVLAYVEGPPVQSLDITITQQAQRIAAEYGLDARELIAEAERIVAGTQDG